LKKGGGHSLTVLDIILTAAVAAAAVWSGFIVYGNKTGEVRVRIEGTEGSWVYPLDEERTVHIKGPLGDTVVHIHDGKANIIASPCPNQTCIAGSAIEHAGDWNACLPNRVMIRGESDEKEESEIDIVAR